MKTKPTTNSNSEKTLKVLHPASVLVRKKRTKDLKPKKTVRFNLMVKFSSSEELLAQKLAPVGELGDDETFAGEQGMDLRSKSSLDVARYPKISRRNVLRSVACYFYKSMHLQHPKRDAGLAVGSFSQHFLFGPILNLTTKVPRKGILKNVQSLSHTLAGRSRDYSTSDRDSSSRSPAQVSSWPSAHAQEPAFTSSDRFNTAEFHFPINTTVWKSPNHESNVLSSEYCLSVNVDNQAQAFDDLTKSVQNLSISAHPQGDLPHSEMSKALMLNVQAKLNYEHFKPASSVYTSSQGTSEFDGSGNNGIDLGTVKEEESCTWSHVESYDMNNNAFEKSPNDYYSNPNSHCPTCRSHHRKLSPSLQTSDIQNSGQESITTNDIHALHSINDGNSITNQHSTLPVYANNSAQSNKVSSSIFHYFRGHLSKSKSERSALSKSNKRKSIQGKSQSCFLNTCKGTCIPPYGSRPVVMRSEEGTLIFAGDFRSNEQKQQHYDDGRCLNTASGSKSDKDTNASSGCSKLCLDVVGGDEAAPPPDDVLYRCPVLNCGQHFTRQQLLLQHLSVMQHSPCDPFSTLIDELIPNICGFLCPLCGQISQDEETCLDHMLKQNHSSLLSPIPFSLFACPQCLHLFPSFSLTLQHMDNLAHHDLAFQFECDILGTNGASPIPVPQRLITVLRTLCSRVTYVISCQDCRQPLSCPTQIQDHLDKCHIVVAKSDKCVKDIFSSLITDQACAECHQFIYTGLPASELCVHTDCPLQGPVLTSRARTLREFILRSGIADINVGTEDNLDLHFDCVNSSVSETCTVKYDTSLGHAASHPASVVGKDSVVLRSIHSHTVCQSSVSNTEVISKTSSSVASPWQQGILSAPTSDYTASPIEEPTVSLKTSGGQLVCRNFDPPQSYVYPAVFKKSPSPAFTDPFEEGTSSQLCGGCARRKGKHSTPVSSSANSVDTNSNQAELSSHSNQGCPSCHSSKGSISSKSTGSSQTMGTTSSTVGQPFTSATNHNYSSDLSASCHISSMLSVTNCQSHVSIPQTGQLFQGKTIITEMDSGIPHLLYRAPPTADDHTKSTTTLNNSAKNHKEIKQDIVRTNNKFITCLQVEKGLGKKDRLYDSLIQSFCSKARNVQDLGTHGRPMHSLLSNHCASHKTAFGPKTNNYTDTEQGEEVLVEAEVENSLGKAPVFQTKLGVINPFNPATGFSAHAFTEKHPQSLFSSEEPKKNKRDKSILGIVKSKFKNSKRKSGLTDQKFPALKKAKVQPVRNFGRNNIMATPVSPRYMLAKQQEPSAQESTYMITEQGDKLNTQHCHNDPDQTRNEIPHSTGNVYCADFIQSNFKPKEVARNFHNAQETGIVISASDSTESFKSDDRFVVNSGSSKPLSGHQRLSADCMRNTCLPAWDRTVNLDGKFSTIETENYGKETEAPKEMALETQVDCGSDSSDVDIVEIDEVKDRFIVVNESLAHDESCFIVEDENESAPDQELRETGDEEGTIVISESDDSCFIVSTPGKVHVNDSPVYVANPQMLCNPESMYKTRQKRKISRRCKGRKYFSAKKKKKSSQSKQKLMKTPQNTGLNTTHKYSDVDLIPEPVIDPKKRFSSTPLPENSQLWKNNRNTDKLIPMSVTPTGKRTSELAKNVISRDISNAEANSTALLHPRNNLSQPSVSPITHQPVKLNRQSHGKSDTQFSSVDCPNMPLPVFPEALASDSVCVISDQKDINKKPSSSTQLSKKQVDHLGKKRRTSLGTMRKWFAWKRKMAIRQKSKLYKSGVSSLYKASASGNQYFTSVGTGQCAFVTGHGALELHKHQQLANLQSQQSTRRKRSEVDVPGPTTSLKLRLDGPTCVSPDKSHHSMNKHQSTTTVKRSAHFRKLISPQMNYLSKMERIVFADLENLMLFKWVLGPWLPSTYVWGFISARPGSPFHSEKYFHQFDLYNLLKEQKCVHVSTDIGTSKDAVDFAMTLAIAKLDDRLPQSIPFFIVSRDKGFLEVENQMRDSQRRVKVVAPWKYVFPKTHFS